MSLPRRSLRADRFLDVACLHPSTIFLRVSPFFWSPRKELLVSFADFLTKTVLRLLSTLLFSIFLGLRFLNCHTSLYLETPTPHPPTTCDPPHMKRPPHPVATGRAGHCLFAGLSFFKSTGYDGHRFHDLDGRTLQTPLCQSPSKYAAATTPETTPLNPP